MSARSRASEMPQRLQALIDDRHALLKAPLTGIYAGECLQPGLYPLQAAGVSTAPVLEVAHAFLDSLSAEQRQRVRFPIDSDEWRTWLNINVHV